MINTLRICTTQRTKVTFVVTISINKGKYGQILLESTYSRVSDLSHEGLKPVIFCFILTFKVGLIE